MLSTYEQNSRRKLTVTVVTVLVVAGVVVWADHIKAGTSGGAGSSLARPASPAAAGTSVAGSAGSAGTARSTATSKPAAATTGYKDGTYTVTSDYTVPHGEEAIQVSLTLSGGTITSASIQNSENDFDSARYQEDFAAEYKTYVVGKKLDGLRLSFVAGASDTTGAFNAALSKIAAQAQA